VPTPKVTVIVPVRNEAAYIERCLYSIAAQDYPRSALEVLVVDGRSEDGTRQVVSRFAAESTIDLRLIDNPRLLPAAAMNVALDSARGDVILRLDGHAALAGHDFISRAVRALDETGADCVGPVLESEGETAAGRAIAAAMSSRFGVGGAAFRTGGAGRVDTVAFGAYRRDVFDRIGRFDETVAGGEDDEFNYRLLDAGGEILLLPELRATYTVRPTFTAAFRQYFRYGRAKPAVLLRHPRQARPRQSTPAAFVLALGIAVVRAVSGRPGALRALLLVYTGAATIASLVLVPRVRARTVPLIPVAFACLHLAYGLGTLAGLLGLAGRAFSRGARAGAHQSTEAPL